MTDSEQSAVTAFLRDPATHGGAGPVGLIETHISRVFLAGDRAFKLKRAVRLPYADFSTPERRLALCEREVALNRPAAGDLYRGVRRITREAGGRLAFDGEGPLADAVVEMERFPQESLFDSMAEAGTLSPALMSDLAALVARVHAGAPVVHAGGGAETMAAVLDVNRAGFAQSRLFAGEAVDRLDAALRSALERHRAALDAREAAGWVRRCHGDLHLRNICLHDGRPTLFDCLEFSDELATVDVLYDLAFLLMDLWHRALPGLASLVANRYFDAGGGDEGFALLPFFMAVRAEVRAHVTATQAEAAEEAKGSLRDLAREYFDLAEALLRPVPARLVVLGGLSGSGKTTVAEALAPSLGAPPGARVVESDRTRKTLWGVSADTPLPAAAYAEDVSNRVYAALAERCRALVGSGASVVAGAVFDRPERRAAFEAATVGLRRDAVWLSAPPDLLRQRVRGRVGGPSDADLAVLESQLARDAGATGWTEIAAGGTVEETVAALRRTLGLG